MSRPKVSIVVATRNRAHLLPRAVDSLLAQSFGEFEIVIIDDNSADNTAGVLANMQMKDSRIRAIRSEAHVGPGAARNLGMRLARGEFVAIMDDDDLALPSRLEVELERFEQDPRLGLVFSSVTWIDQEMHPLTVFPGIVQRGDFPSEPEGVFRLLYLEGNKIPNTTILVRRAVTELLGYPDAPWIGEDWYWCMQLSAMGVRMAGIPTPLVRQLRDRAVPGLMSRRAEALTAQRQVLKMIRHWLRAEKIRSFDRIHRVAWSNQLVREAHYWSGFRGMRLILRALATAPSNPTAARGLAWIGRNALRKAGFLQVRMVADQDFGSNGQ